jgi:hypothetical protein
MYAALFYLRNCKVPMDQPEAALSLLNGFLANKAFY